MSDQLLGFYVGACGHPVPISANNMRIGACRCERRTTSRPGEDASSHDGGPTRRPAYFDQLAATVEELGRLRWTLRQVIALADDAPGLTDEQLRDRLLALADRTRHRDPGAT